MFNGRHYTQGADFSIHIDMQEFIEERLSPVENLKGDMLWQTRVDPRRSVRQGRFWDH